MRASLAAAGARESSTRFSCSGKSGDPTCKPSCASHSAASRLPGLADHLFKHRHAESRTTEFRDRRRSSRLLRPPQDNDRVRQRWNASARESAQLLESAGDAQRARRPPHRRSSRAEHTHRAVGQNASRETREPASPCGARDGRGTQTGPSVRFEIIRQSQLNCRFRRPLFSADFR